MPTMSIEEYFHKVQMPAYVAVEALRRAGLPVHKARVVQQLQAWREEMAAYEREVEGMAAQCGYRLKYSVAHTPLPDATFRDFLFHPTKGLKLEIFKLTETGAPSADDEALLYYATVGPNHNMLNGVVCEDHPVVYRILLIRSLKTACQTHLTGLLNWCASDGCVHARFLWDKENTTRLSAADPPLQQIPERANPLVAKAVKSCLVPREKPWLGPSEEWDPKKHGWCAKVDVKGAEAVIRAGCIAKCRVSTPYLREGRDIHSKSAAILLRVPDGTYTKGMFQRDQVGKNSYFLLIFGGSAGALRQTLWEKARIWHTFEEAKELFENFYVGYPDLAAQYERDTWRLLHVGYIEDGYGRRWRMPPPEGVYPLPGRAVNGGPSGFGHPGYQTNEQQKRLNSIMGGLQHRYANRRTQCDQATTTLWGLALVYHGEYVELRVPDCWSAHGVLFPEAREWQFNGGRGPGGKPFRAWLNNTVHDSLWADGAPGTLEPAMKVLHRRLQAIPAWFLLEANLPWRIEAEVGPDFGHLTEYNKVANQFGLEPMPSI